MRDLAIHAQIKKNEAKGKLKQEMRELNQLISNSTEVERERHERAKKGLLTMDECLYALGQ